SIPTAAGMSRHSLESPWTNDSSKVVGRLSTQSQPMSSSASRTVDFPAPDIPVTSRRRGGEGRDGTAPVLEFQAEAVESERNLGRGGCCQRIHAHQGQVDSEDWPLPALVRQPLDLACELDH